MERSEQVNELAGALSKAQGVIIPAIKDSDNPFFKSKYADLAAVWDVARKPLSNNGLSVIQVPSAEGNQVKLETILLHSSGQFISGVLTMTAKDGTPQSIGSCITYARRYGLSAVLGIASEIDDDGNAATHHSVPSKKNDDTSKHNADMKEIFGPPVTMKSILLGEAKKKFPSVDEFHAWRVDQGLVEDLDSLVVDGKENGIEFAKIIRLVQALPLKGDKK